MRATTLTSAPKRWISTSVAHLPTFPPKEFIKSHPSHPSFSPETWGSLQPPHQSALTAFAHRIGLGSILTTPDLIQQARTHSSFVPFYQRYYPKSHPPPSNDHLAVLVNTL